MEAASAEAKISRIVARFGGRVEMAKALGHKNVSTVQGWIDRAAIPPKQQPDVLDAAARLDLRMELEDFVFFDLQHPAFYLKGRPGWKGSPAA